MHRTQVPLPHQLDEKCPHGGRRQQVELTLGLTKSGKIDRNEMELLGQAVPYLPEGEQALWPGAGQDRRFAPALAGFGEADLDAVCFADR